MVAFFWVCMFSCFGFLRFVEFCVFLQCLFLSVSFKQLAVKTASEMTQTASGWPPLNSTHSLTHSLTHTSVVITHTLERSLFHDLHAAVRIFMNFSLSRNPNEFFQFSVLRKRLTLLSFLSQILVCLLRDYVIILDAIIEIFTNLYTYFLHNMAAYHCGGRRMWCQKERYI